MRIEETVKKLLSVLSTYDAETVRSIEETLVSLRRLIRENVEAARGCGVLATAIEEEEVKLEGTA